MNDKIKAMLELEKRGKLPEKFAPILAEARSRGLIPGGETKAPEETTGGPPQISREQAQGAVDRVNENIWGDDDP
ncbi:MAG: hypothetical protein ACPGFC_07615, partial [Paracoccaceae bacterium]